MYKYFKRIGWFVGKKHTSAPDPDRIVRKMSNRMVADDREASEIASNLSRIVSTIKTLEEQKVELVNTLVSMGYAGCDVPVQSGDWMVTLSNGEEKRLDVAKAQEVLGSKYDLILQMKRETVKPTLTDVKGMCSKEELEAITKTVTATVKVTVRKA